MTTLRTEKEKIKQPKALQCLAKGTDNATLAIRSTYFGTYLCMDGRNCAEGGEGKVYSHSSVTLWGMFRIVPQGDGSVAIQSIQSDTWLRMDPRNVEDESGGGIVNCQSFVGAMERFNVVAQDDGTVAIQSVQYNTYLRVESLGVSLQPNGGGTVNCAKEVRSWERFNLRVIQPIFGIKSKAQRSHYLRMDCHEETNSVIGKAYFGPWQKFEFTWAEDGSIGVKSIAFKKYLSVDGGRVSCSSTMGPKEKFVIILQPDGSVAFKSLESNLFLSMNEGEVSTKTSIETSEKFEIIVDCESGVQIDRKIDI